MIGGSALRAAFTPLPAALALLLALGCGAGCSSRRATRAAAADSSTGAAGADTAASDADIARALSQAHPAGEETDSTAIKNAWHDDVQGYELDGLNLVQRAIFVRYANSEHCTCGCGYTLAGCLASDMSCEVSRAAITALLDSVRTGRIRSARGLRERPADP
jgi:hypothetical protein